MLRRNRRVNVFLSSEIGGNFSLHFIPPCLPPLTLNFEIHLFLTRCPVHEGMKFSISPEHPVCLAIQGKHWNSGHRLKWRDQIDIRKLRICRPAYPEARGNSVGTQKFSGEKVGIFEVNYEQEYSRERNVKRAYVRIFESWERNFCNFSRVNWALNWQLSPKCGSPVSGKIQHD